MSGQRASNHSQKDEARLDTLGAATRAPTTILVRLVLLSVVAEHVHADARYDFVECVFFQEVITIHVVLGE
jgi:hypothetical protein